MWPHRKEENGNEIKQLLHLHPYTEIKCYLNFHPKATSINFSRTFGCSQNFTTTFFMKNISSLANIS